MSFTTDRRAIWFAPLGTALAFLACYGTLAAVSILSLLGISITVPEGIWAGAIILFTLLAIGGIVQGWRRHRLALPVVLGLIGTGLLLWVMAVTYSGQRK